MILLPDSLAAYIAEERVTIGLCLQKRNREGVRRCAARIIGRLNSHFQLPETTLSVRKSDGTPVSRRKIRAGFYRHPGIQHPKGHIHIAIGKWSMKPEDSVTGTILHEWLHHYDLHIRKPKDAHDAEFFSILEYLMRATNTAVRAEIGEERQQP